jgi:hypothetical protein
MAHKFLHVGLMFAGLPKTSELDATVTLVSDDWIRYANNNWILWTERSAENVYNALKPVIGTNDQMLIVGLDMTERNGWLARWVWEWIAAKRSGSPRTVSDIFAELMPEQKKEPRPLPGLLGDRGNNGLLDFLTPPKPRN